MLSRDLLLVAVTAAVSSFLTYVVMERDSSNTPPTALSIIANEKAPEQPSPDDKPILVQAGERPAIVTDESNDLLQSGGMKNAKEETDTGQQASVSLQKQAELERNFTGFFEKKRGMDAGQLNAEIESRFYQEEWNREWAQDRESGIHNLFQTDAGLSNISPLHVACRSKNCQVVLPVANREQAQNLSIKFMEIAAGSDLGMNDKSISFFPDISTGRLVFYLSDNGNMDLFQ